MAAAPTLLPLPPPPDTWGLFDGARILIRKEKVMQQQQEKKEIEVPSTRVMMHA